MPPTQIPIPETTVPPPMSTVTGGTATSTVTAQPVLRPLTAAPARQGLGFDSWSPDGRWIGYWVGDAEGPAHLAFADVHTGRTCQHEEVDAQDWSRRLIWQGDDKVSAVVNQQGEALAGTVCGALAPVEAVAFPGRVTADEPSPDGRYRAEERIVRWEGEAEYKTLVMSESGTGRTVATVSYVGSPHILRTGQGWLNDRLYLIGKTVDRGVLYVSLPEGKLGHVLPDLWGLNESDEEYIWLVQSQANPASGEYHLLLQEYKDDAPQFPVLLYHSELDQLEEIPFYLAWPFFEGSSFTPDGQWLLLGDPVSEGEPTGTINYWLRPVDPPGSAAVRASTSMKIDGVPAQAREMAEIVAKAVDYKWAFCGSSLELGQMAFARETSVMIFGLRDGQLLGGYSTSPYDTRYLWWSPDGSRAVATGYDARVEQEALFVIEIPPAAPAAELPNAGPADEGTVVFTLPVGTDGVQYGAERTGPMALAVAPDGTFWIADTQGGRLLHYDPDGTLLNRIDLSGYGLYGPSDVEAVGSDVLVLCSSGKVLRLTAGGDLLATYDIPDNLGPEGGLTGLAVGDHGEILLEFEMGAQITQLVNAQGVLEPRQLPGYTHEGRLYKAQLARGWTSHGSITAGSTRIDVTVPEILAGLWLLGFASDGSLYVVVEEMDRTAPTVTIHQTVRLYGSSGELLGSTPVPLDKQYTYVQHGLGIGPDGNIYALPTRPDRVEVVRLAFSTEAATPAASPTAPPTRAGIRPASAGACSDSTEVMRKVLGMEGL